MSNNEIKPVSKYPIVQAAAAFFNLGDSGKMDSFIGRAIKVLTNEIETLERSKSNEKHNLEAKLSELNERLEDAEDARDEAYLNFPPEKIKTNEEQRAYLDTYLENVSQKEAIILGIKKSIEEEQKASDAVIAQKDEQIAVRQKHLDKINKK